jgi:hypothetical protein
MKRILSVLALILLGAVTVTFGAGTTANLTWTLPTKYTNGTTLPATDLAYTTISWTPQAGNSPGLTGSVKVTAPATTTVVSVPCSSVNFFASVTTTSGATYPNATSTNAGPVPYATGIVCTANPPTGLAVH